MISLVYPIGCLHENTFDSIQHVECPGGATGTQQTKASIAGKAEVSPHVGGISSFESLKPC